MGVPNATLYTISNIVVPKICGILGVPIEHVTFGDVEKPKIKRVAVKRLKLASFLALDLYFFELQFTSSCLRAIAVRDENEGGPKEGHTSRTSCILLLSYSSVCSSDSESEIPTYYRLCTFDMEELRTGRSWLRL